MSATFWFKSSYSHENGDACVEFCQPKSSRHAADLKIGAGTAAPTTHIGIRDSKSPALRPLTVPAPAWQAFIAELCNN